MKKLRLRVLLLMVMGITMPISLISQTVETFTTSGSWVCPSGVTSVTVECWGAGGGGGSSDDGTAKGGSGGGGGAYCKSVLSLTPGNTYYFSAGSAGTGAPSSSTSPATAGGGSWFNNINSAPTSTTGVLAGGGGLGGNNGGAVGAAGAATYWLTTGTPGTAGTVGVAAGGGNGGAGANGGAGGAGSSTSNGANGTAPGGGGGGSDDIAATYGGNGGAGKVVLTYTCPNQSLTYSQGFNTTLTPGCWTQQYVTGTSAIQFLASSSSPSTTPQEGADYVYWNSYDILSGNSTRLVSSPITTTGTSSVDVEFYWMHDNGSSGSADGVYVEYSTDGSSWTQVGSMISRYDASLTGWNKKTVTLPAGAGNQATIYVGFRFYSAYGNNCSMDNVVIKPSPTCITPTNVTTNNITSTTASISWTAASPAPSNGYTYEIRTSGAAGSGATGLTTSGLTAAGVVSKNITGLSPSTTYFVYVRSYCGGSDYSSWTSFYMFTTPCNVVSSFPWTEGFETGYADATTVAGCWSQVSTTGADAWKANSSATSYNRTPRTGSFNATLYYNNEDWLFYPFTFTAGTTYMFEMYVRQDGTTTSDANITVAYGANATTGAMTNSVVAQTGITNGNYQLLTGTFSPATTGTYYIGIKGYMNSAPYYISIDDIKIDIATAMAYSSCTTTQSNVNSVAPGATSQEVIGMQVVTTGVTSPLTASSFTFNTNGSTSVSNIVNAKLWTTGTSSTFATTTQLGSATVSPSGSFTITGGTNMPYTLSSGTNYFWLTYDIVASPTLHDVVDAECTSITVSSARTPTITAPSGSRPIEIVYCTPTYSSGGSSDNIAHVVLEGLNDTPPANNSPYYFNRTSGQNTVPTLNNSQTHTLSVTLGTDGNQYSRAWVDFNQNGTFEASESFSTGTNAGSNGTVNISIVVPAGALSGQTMMRVRGGEDAAITDAQACGASSSSYGQGLDYYVNITPAVNMSYVSCTSTQSNTNIISTGSQNQEIICMKVVTSGSLNPLSLTEFIMRTDGSTNYSTDLRNAKIWYTGSASSFSTANQFGFTIASPTASGTDMIFSGTQSLVPGTNYFWFTYDIPSTATNGDFADAKFQSVVIAGTMKTPTVSEPGGNREIIRGCFYTLTLKDDSGNGWDDNLLTVKVNGTTRLNNVTFSSGYTSTYQFIAETGQTITTEYTAGASSSEKSYFITNPNGAYVTSSGEAQSVPVNKSATADCNAVKQFTTNVDTYQSGTSCFIITEAKASEKGSVWSNYKIDMTQNFSIDFDIYLGDSEGGADGVVFALQGSCTSAGGNGNSMGYGGISNSIGVEFDTYDNGDNSDLSSDHFAIISGGSADHSLSSNLTGPASLANMEDNVWHTASISWNATSHLFKIKYGSSDSLTYTGDIVTDLFAGNSQVFWGFTGATGMYYNTQKVCITSYPQNSTQVADTTIEAGDSINVQAATGASSYTWIPDDGSVSNATIANPVLSPAVTTEYTCLIEDGCGNIITNKFTVQVNATLPVELMDFSANCQSNGVELSWETASELNNDYFIIEKSNDMSTYSQIAQIRGAGNSTTQSTYHFVDDKYNGLTYYRLSQVDFNGKRNIFDPIAKECSEDKAEIISIYPNPATEWFILGLPSDEIAKIQILNITGMIVSEREEVSSVSKIDISSLAKGVYIIKVLIGDEIYYCKLSKN